MPLKVLPCERAEQIRPLTGQRLASSLHGLGLGGGVAGQVEGFHQGSASTSFAGAVLARRLGVSQPWVSMVLAGKRDPGMARSAHLLRTVGWTLELVPVEEEPVKRRRFLASAASVALIPSATSTSPYRDAAYVRLLADRLAHTEEQIGGTPLVREALRHLTRVTPAVATLSLIRNYDGPRSRAAQYVRRGLALKGVDDATRAELLVRFARSLAGVSGQERAVRDALQEAQGLADGLNPVDRAEVMANSGIALVDCGLHDQGAANLQAAIASVQAQSPLLIGLYRARLTKSAIQAGDVGGMVVGMDALALVLPLLTSRRMDIHVHHILADTTRWETVREMRHAREHLREVTR